MRPQRFKSNFYVLPTKERKPHKEINFKKKKKKINSSAVHALHLGYAGCISGTDLAMPCHRMHVFHTMLEEKSCPHVLSVIHRQL